MPRTCDLELGGRFMGLFIGPNGCGKTIAAASWPGRTMIYDFDGRVRPIRFFYPNRKDIEYITVGAVKDSRNPSVIGFKEWCDDFEDLQDRCDYDNIIVDSVTSLTATAVMFQLGMKGEGQGKKVAGGIKVPTWDEFNGETSVMHQILEVAKILPCNVIFTAHPIAKSELGADGKTMRRHNSIACFGNKTPSIVPGFFDEIYTFSVEPPDAPGDPAKRYITTQPNGVDVGKSALPLPRIIEITNKPLFGIIQSHLATHNLKLQEKIDATTTAK